MINFTYKINFFLTLMSPSSTTVDEVELVEFRVISTGTLETLFMFLNKIKFKDSSIRIKIQTLKRSIYILDIYNIMFIQAKKN